MSDSTILSVEDLAKTYGNGALQHAALQGVTFSLRAGSTCAIVGPSGSGKTTLIGLCAGLERPSSGTVTLDGTNLAPLSEGELAAFRNQYVGFVFQTFQLIPTLTALENVMVPGELRGDNRAREQAIELLRQVGLQDRWRHYPAQLSGGEQQRVAIARAFMNAPKLLFADEPTANLDLETSNHVVRLLFALNKTRGTTLVLVTHDTELTEYAERIIQLKGGRIVADKTRAPRFCRDAGGAEP
jgi:putative ABC transport system ATP-binding protein